MTAKPQLKLETTGQYLALPLVGSHLNERPVRTAVERTIAELRRVSGH